MQGGRWRCRDSVQGGRWRGVGRVRGVPGGWWRRRWAAHLFEFLERQVTLASELRGAEAGRLQLVEGVAGLEQLDSREASLRTAHADFERERSAHRRATHR